MQVAIDNEPVTFFRLTFRDDESKCVTKPNSLKVKQQKAMS